MKEKRILGIYALNRRSTALKMQKIFSKYGCLIKTRLGLHEASERTCEESALILLELVGNSKEWDKLEKELKIIAGIKIKKMSFSD